MLYFCHFHCNICKHTWNEVLGHSMAVMCPKCACLNSPELAEQLEEKENSHEPSQPTRSTA